MIIHMLILQNRWCLLNYFHSSFGLIHVVSQPVIVHIIAGIEFYACLWTMFFYAPLFSYKLHALYPVPRAPQLAAIITFKEFWVIMIYKSQAF